MNNAINATDNAFLIVEWYYQSFFSGKANRRYKDIGTILGILMVKTIIAGIQSRIIYQKWVDGLVEQALVTTEVEETPVLTPLPPLTQRLGALKGPQLRRLCVVKGINYRHFNGPKKHMKVAQMREALVTALVNQ
jgi:hypothetical protein